MTYKEALELLEQKNQTQLLRYYDELGEAGKKNLLTSIESIVWDFEQELNVPANVSPCGRDIRPIDGLKIPAIEARRSESENIGI